MKNFVPRNIKKYALSSITDKKSYYIISYYIISFILFYFIYFFFALYSSIFFSFLFFFLLFYSFLHFLTLRYSVASHHPPEGRPSGPISEGILWAIVNLSAGGLENEDKLGCVGVVDLVGCIMETYSNREGMFDLALNALIHLIYHSEDNKMRVGNINVINNDSNNGNNNGNNGIRNEILEIRKEKKIFSTVCNIIEKYEDNENIAENIFQFFLLSLNGNINSNNLNKEKLLSLDILIIISKIMSTNSIHSEVIRLGCGLLLVLRFDDETYKEKLRGLDQLDERGKAKPKGSYEDIARIWECTDSRAVSTDVRLMTGSSVSSIHMLV